MSLCLWHSMLCQLNHCIRYFQMLPKTLLFNNYCGCDIESAFDQWSEMKLFMKRNPHYRALHSLNLWQRFSKEDCGRNNCSNIMKLVYLTTVYPLANAACERGFSTMKRVKSDWRCALGTNTMSMLMRVKN